MPDLKQVINVALTRMGVEGVHAGDLLENMPAEGVVRLGQLIDQARRGAREEASVHFGPYKLDRAHGVLCASGREDIILTEKEQHILELLARAQGEAVERDELLSRVWGYVEGLETHTLETHIYRLRQKIEPDPANPVYLCTAEGGYRLG